MYKFRWLKFHEFPISHSCKRRETWSNPRSETEILSVEYLIVSFNLLNTKTNQPSIGFHLPDASSILAHLKTIVRKMWGRSVLDLVNFLRDGFQSGFSSVFSSMSLRGWPIRWSRGSSGQIDSLTRMGS